MKNWTEKEIQSEINKKFRKYPANPNNGLIQILKKIEKKENEMR